MTAVALVTHDVVTFSVMQLHYRGEFAVCCQNYRENNLSDSAIFFFLVLCKSEIFLNDHWREGSKGNNHKYEDLRRFCFPFAY